MSEVKVIGIGNDHAAVDLKNEIKAYLEEKGYKVVNYGTDSSESCDYPVYGAKVGNAVASGEVLEIPAKPTPVKDDGKSPIPVVPTRAMPEVSTAPATRKMTMEEFAQQREAILRNLEAEYGAQ